MSRPFLTIIIPAYNEAQRLPDSLTKIAEYLRRQPFATEILVVENRSTDETSAVVRDFATKVSASDPFTLDLLHSAPGKGAAVKTGMLVGKGDYLFICDADLSMPIEEVAKFLPPQLDPDGFDVAIASREIVGAVRYNEPFYRHLMGRVFNHVVQKLIVPGIEDTQCGFKMFTREAAAQVFPHQTIDGWGFDPEILYISRIRGLNLVEVPINWYYMAESRINPLLDTINMVREVLRIRLNGLRGIYEQVPRTTE
ncbi:MAG: glycosyltransferase family 2 protein [Caldilineaceae bacterium]|nr:glycosyltransferase family 2 protein [Caldilineaceae bacterium]